MTGSKAAIAMTDSAAPVMAEHRFDEAALSRYMEKHVDGYRGPFEVGQCMGGMSNPTFVLTDAGGTALHLAQEAARGPVAFGPCG